MRGAAILTVMLGSMLAWLLLGTPSTGVDDAHLFLRQARGFLSGEGVAGGSGSLLWLMVCAAAQLLNRTAELPLLLANLLFGSITILLCLKRSNQKLLFLALLCAAPAWFAWCQIALEGTGLWCLLLTASTLAVSERNTGRCTWLLPLLALTRPEAMLWGWWLLLLLIVALSIDHGRRAGLRAAFYPLFSFGAIWSVVLLLQGIHLGGLYPGDATLWLSTLREDALAACLYLPAYLISNPAVFLVMLIFVWVCIREMMLKRELSRVVTVCLGLLPGLAMALFHGDNLFSGFKLYQPLWPLLCLVAAWGLPLILTRMRQPSRRLIPVALILAGWVIFAFSPGMKNEFSASAQSRRQGHVLTRMFAEWELLPSVCTEEIGGCGYAYPGMVCDIKELRLNRADSLAGIIEAADTLLPDEEIHDSGYPDILLLNVTGLFESTAAGDLQSSRWFQQRYLSGELWYNGEILSGHFSRRFLKGLEQGHYAFIQDIRRTIDLEAPQDPAFTSSQQAPTEGLASRKSESIFSDLPPGS